MDLSTLKASYRFYHDSFGLDAHSVEVQAFQYILPRLYVRGSYRFHSQDGVDFFSRRLRGNFDRAAPRTADSDLAPFDSTSAGAKVVYLFNPAGSSKPGSEYFDMSFERYFRDDLHVNVFSLAYGTSF